MEKTHCSTLGNSVLPFSLSVRGKREVCAQKRDPRVPKEEGNERVGVLATEGECQDRLGPRCRCSWEFRLSGSRMPLLGWAVGTIGKLHQGSFVVLKAESGLQWSKGHMEDE